MLNYAAILLILSIFKCIDGENKMANVLLPLSRTDMNPSMVMQKIVANLSHGMCTGFFRETNIGMAGNGMQRPPAGTKCSKPCVFQSGRWGSSWCHTDDKQWGGECVKCQYELVGHGIECGDDINTHLSLQTYLPLLPIRKGADNPLADNSCYQLAADNPRCGGYFELNVRKEKNICRCIQPGKQCRLDRDGATILYRLTSMCTGNFMETNIGMAGNGMQRPPAGTKCSKPCVFQSGRWGSSWCHTDDKQWGGECVTCPARDSKIPFKSSTSLQGNAIAGVNARWPGQILATTPHLAAGEGHDSTIGTYSSESMPYGAIGFQFKVTDDISHIMFGLSHGNTNNGWEDIDYAFGLRGQWAGPLQLEVSVRGSPKGSFGKYVVGDVFVQIIGAKNVRFYRNRKLIYTASSAPTLPLLVDASFYAPSSLTDIVWIYSWP